MMVLFTVTFSYWTQAANVQLNVHFSTQHSSISDDTDYCTIFIVTLHVLCEYVCLSSTHSDRYWQVIDISNPVWFQWCIKSALSIIPFHCKTVNESHDTYSHNGSVIFCVECEVMFHPKNMEYSTWLYVWCHKLSMRFKYNMIMWLWNVYISFSTILVYC